MRNLTVADAMHPGVFSVDPDTPVTAVAAEMAERRIHCLVVAGEGDWGLVSDMDVLAAVHTGSTADARRLAATEPVSVAATLPLGEAVTLMVEHDLSHVVVVDEGDGTPAGVLSSLDVARVVAEQAAAV